MAAGYHDDTPTARLVRQVLGAIAEFDKAIYCRQAVALAKRLRCASPKTAGERCSLRDISDILADEGHLNEHGRPFNPRSVKSMVES